MSETKVILVLDDERKEREETLRRLLDSLGRISWPEHFSHESFRSGEIADSITSADIAHLAPDLIVLDLCFLNQDPTRGIVLLAKLREQEPLARTPVIVVSDRMSDPTVRTKLNRIGLADDRLFDWKAVATNEEVGIAFKRLAQDLLESGGRR